MEKNNNEKKEGFYKFFELHTEYGPLYVYEKYKEDPNHTEPFYREMPTTREFFTNEEGIRGYCVLEFMDRTASFTTIDMGMNGFPREEFMEELQPYEFLMKVAPFIETPQDKQEKAREIYDIFTNKAKNVGNSRIMRKQPEVSENTKNEIAKELLKKYVK